MFDPEKFGKAMGEVIREATEPLLKRIGELEKQLAEKPDVSVMIAAQVAAAVAALPKPENGKDGAPGRDGVDGRDGAEGPPGLKGEAGPPGPAGEPGAQGERGEKGEDGKPGQNGADGRDGADGKSFTIEDADQLIGQKMAGWELDFERRAVATLEKAVDRIPKPKDGVDGAPGVNGKDGAGFDDLQMDFDGERTVSLKFVQGDRVKSVDLCLPIVVDQGVFKEGQQYQPGDGVTWGGSYWIAQKATGCKPDTPDSGFRLAVKKGRDGRDGRDGIDKTAPVKLEG